MSPCFECGAPGQVMHHVVPRSKGGTKMVPLCIPCHDIVHEMKTPMNHRELVADGVRRAWAEGKKVGRPRV